MNQPREYRHLAQNLLDQISLTEAMTSQRSAFEALATGSGAMGARGIITHDANAQFAYVARASSTGTTVVKFGSVTPNNSQRQKPVVQAHIAVLDQETGILKYLIEGEKITIARTTAASMVAASLLANPPQNILVVGNGPQGQAHFQAAEMLFPSVNINFYDRTQPTQINQSDLIFLCTNSLDSVIDEALIDGTTIISIGSFAPGRNEVGTKVFESVDKIIGDDANTCKAQCGSIINALAAGVLEEQNILSIGDLLTKKVSGRENPNDKIIYFSVGLGIQDAAFIDMLERNGFIHA